MPSTERSESDPYSPPLSDILATASTRRLSRLEKVSLAASITMVALILTFFALPRAGLDMDPALDAWIPVLFFVYAIAIVVSLVGLAVGIAVCAARPTRVWIGIVGTLLSLLPWAPFAIALYVSS